MNNRQAKNHLRNMALTLLLLTAASCGEFLTMEVDGYISATSMHIDRSEFVMMKGDVCQLAPIFEPDTVSLPPIYWQSEDTAVVRIVDGAVKGVEKGTAQVTAVSVDGMLRDTCTVHVVDTWSMSFYTYPYDMVIYADVRLNGEPTGDDMLVAAFVGDEIRGVSQRLTSNGVDYTVLRVYSPTGEGEIITLRAYSRTTIRFYDIATTYVFDGETHGRLSQLEVLDIVDN